MPIVSIYRQFAEPRDPYPRFRFTRDGLPDPNPVPGRPNPDEKTRWCIDRVAFFAWSDPVEASGLVPVYESFAIDADARVRYAYSSDPAPPAGFTARPYVAFWAYPDGSQSGVPIYLYVQRTSAGENYALSSNPKLGDPWSVQRIAFRAETTVPIEVSLRRDSTDRHRYHFTYSPSTVNVAYPCTLRFTQAPRSDWRFVALEIVNGGENFDRPVVKDTEVRVSARYVRTGVDFKYRVTVQVFNGPEKLVGDPEVVNQFPDGF